MKMKHYLPMAVLALSLAACSDDYDDTALWEQVNDNTSRIEALEQWQDEVNNNIAALQQLLNTTDYITSVIPVMKNGKEVGYTISFRNSDPITIYHGEKGDKGDKGDQGEQGIQGEPGKDGADGTDGSDGSDGYTPQIGLTQQADGNWYWTLDGEPMLDPNGDPIRANGDKGDKGEQGEDGDKGDTGDTGASAPTPQIKQGSTLAADGTYYGIDGTKQDTPDAGAWYLSVDNGKTWYRISGDKGEQGEQGDTGETGGQGQQGDSWFACAPTLSNDGTHYIFTLADNGGTIEVAAYQHFQILTEDEHNSSGTSDNGTAAVRAEGKTTFYLSMNAETDYKAIVAEVTPLDDGVALTRAGEWSATVQETADGNITVTVTAPADGKALLDVSLIRADGSKVTASRVLEALGFTTADGGTTYIIYTAGGLKAWAAEVQNDASLNCTLADDITLSEVTDGGSNWTPIQGYAGTFDGGGKTITGLTINKSTMNVGLFASIAEGGTVKNLTLDDVNITASSSNVGAIAGENRGIIENCSVSGSVTSSRMYSDCVGGIVGQNNGTITGCTVEGSVKAKDADSVGGIAGWNYRGTITDCHSSATVEGLSRVGGIAGKSNASITACSSTGDVTATKNSMDYSWAGGVVGEFTGRSQLIACYATGNVKGDAKYVGGVVGDNVYNAVIACYATGSVTGASGSTGGVVGRNFKDDFSSGTVTACYWDNNQSSGIGEDLTNNGETTKVTSGDWTEAMNAMNMALTNAGTDWRYATGSGDIPLTLYKQ